MPKSQRLARRPNTWTQPQTFVGALTVIVEGQPITFRPRLTRTGGELVIGVDVEVDGGWKSAADRTNP